MKESSLWYLVGHVWMAGASVSGKWGMIIIAVLCFAAAAVASFLDARAADREENS